MIKAVITGDIVQSTHTNVTDRDRLLNVIKETIKALENESLLRYDIYRGDSFQIELSSPQWALRGALLVRAALLKNSPDYLRWDARISVGLGKVEYESLNRVAESDGEAFWYSGRELDALGKTKRLVLKTAWDEINDEFKVSTAFVDDIVSQWTIAQADVMYEWLLDEQITQREIAQKLHKTPQAVSKALASAKASLIGLYLDRYQQCLSNYLKKNTYYELK